MAVLSRDNISMPSVHDSLTPDALVSEFHRAWRDASSPPELGEFVAGHDSVPVRVLADLVLVDQRFGWDTGRAKSVEDYLRLFPALAANRETLGDLIYGEYRCRERAGERPQIEDFARRFPEFAVELRRQLEIASWGAVETQSIGFDEIRTADEVPRFPRDFGPYELLSVLGRGGMATVYRARHRELDREVALKVVRDGSDASPSRRQRFENEARAISRLNHPQIVPIYEIGDCGGDRYFTSKLYARGSLSQRIDEFRGQPRKSAAMVERIARGVHYAHEHGILHRDLKPQNILLEDDGTPVVGDFGLAMSLANDSQLTRTGEILGTLNYLAPECLSGDRTQVGVATDVYGLGAILYQLLTGQPPFAGDRQVEVLDALRRHDPVAPRQRDPSVPADLDTICRKALAKQPGRRYASAAGLADDLRCFLEGRPISARPVGRWERSRLWTKAHPALAALAATVMLSLLGFISVLMVANLRQSDLNRRLQTALESSQAATAAAKSAQSQAEVARQEALRHAATSDELLYAAQVHRANQLEQVGDVEQALILLNRWIPAKGESDRRGVEWRLVKQKLQKPGELLLQLPHDASCVRHSIDRTYLVAATDGGVVRRYELSTGRELPTWETDLFDVRRMEFSPNGQLLAVISYDGEVALLETATGRVRYRFPQPEKNVGPPDVAFDSTGSRLFVSGTGGWIKVWNVDSGKLQHNWNVSDGVSDMEAFPGMKGIALLTPVHSGYDSVFVYTEPMTDRIGYFYNQVRGLCSVAVSHSGRYVAVGSTDGEVEVWDWRKSKQLAKLTLSEKINELTFSADDHLLAAAERTGVVHVWRWTQNLDDPAVAKTSNAASSSAKPSTLESDSQRDHSTHIHWRAHPRPARSVIFSPDSQQVISTGIDGRVMRWAWDKGDVRRISQTCNDDEELAWVDGSRRLAISNPDALRVVDESSEELAVNPSVFNGSHKVASSSDGRWLARNTYPGAILCWDLASSNPPFELPESSSLPCRALSLTFRPDSTHLIAAIETPPEILCWDVASQRMLWRRPFEPFTWGGLVFSEHDGTMIAATNQSLHMIDGDSGRELQQWPFDGQGAWCLAASPTEPLVAVGCDRRIELFNTSTGRVERTLVGHPGAVDQLQFTPDGKTLLALDDRGQLKFWQVAHGSELLTWPSHEPIAAFKLSSDDNRLAICYERETEIVEISALDELN